MSIVVETGEGVDGANSYVGVQEAINFAYSRGKNLPCDIEDVAPLLFRAMDYIESHVDRFCGQKTTSGQALSWPRKNAYIANELVSSSSIPEQLKQAQMQMCIALNDGYDPMSSKSGSPFVTEKTVDRLKIRYAESSQNNRDRVLIVDRLLSLLFREGSQLRFAKA